MKSLVHLGLVTLLAAITVTAFPHPTQAAVVSLTAGVTSNSTGGVLDVTVTMSSFGLWSTTDTHANGIHGNTASYHYYAQNAGIQFVGSRMKTYGLPLLKSNALSGDYRCWALAHGNGWAQASGDGYVTVP